ncbi:MAG: hypothetical protein ABEI58_03405 [Candidatus Nanohaloarchaea archaeon]
MEAEITSVRENPLMERRDVEVRLRHEGEATPSEEDVVDRISAENNIDSDKIEVEGIYTGFGRQESKALLKVFEEFEYEEELEREVETEVEETGKDVEQDTEDEGHDYDEIVSGTITEAKEALGELDDPDYEAALEAEKDNKNRKTLVEWLESQ